MSTQTYAGYDRRLESHLCLKGLHGRHLHEQLPTPPEQRFDSLLYLFKCTKITSVCLVLRWALRFLFSVKDLPQPGKLQG